MDSAAVVEQKADWGLAVRAFSFPASIVPVVLGSVLAWYSTGQFSWILFILALAAGVFYHCGCNLVNDVFDHKKGVDREGAYGGSGVLVSGSMQPAQLMAGARNFFILGSLIGLYFLYHFHVHSVTPWPLGWPLLAIGLAGLLGAIFYTAGDNSAKFSALGVPLVFIMMGTLMVLGGWFVQTGTLSMLPVLVSIPVGFMVAAILHANDIRDIDDDTKAGVRTLSSIVGPAKARQQYYFMLFAPYVCVVIFAVFGIIPWTGLAPLLTLPLAIPLAKLFATTPETDAAKLNPSIEGTAKLHMAFGMLLSVGLIAGKLLGM
jgi:1,4-dihydroxy-2-naphthoate octaprenyltransferase